MGVDCSIQAPSAEIITFVKGVDKTSVVAIKVNSSVISKMDNKEQCCSSSPSVNCLVFSEKGGADTEKEGVIKRVQVGKTYSNPPKGWV